MRLDPKYFNLFIAFCALITIVVIVYGTINYSKNQAEDFRDNIAEVQLDTLSFKSYTGDSLSLSHLKGDPVVIQFWSTWSGKSLDVNSQLEEYRKNNPGLKIVAAAVRDGEEQVRDYIQSKDFDFIYVEGTDFFQHLLVPGVPSQIFIDENGMLFTVQVGEDSAALSDKLNRLLRNE